MVFNIDFDGTCTTHDYPLIGKDIGAQRVLKRLTDNGHQLILFTMRSDDKMDEFYRQGNTYLSDVVNWFRINNIPLYGIQSNPTQLQWTTSPKSHADFMIDDSAIGCPLKWDLSISNRPFVDWIELEKILDVMKEKTPLKRLGQPADVAYALLFLASDEANFINGIVLPIDGGLMI